MSYITLTEAKGFLGITNSNQNLVLQVMLDGTSSYIETMLGYDPILGTKKESIKICDVLGSVIYLHTPNITEITKINGIAYTGVLGTDYIIAPPQNRKLIINDLYTYYNIGNSQFPYFEIEYTAGYEITDPIMKDLKYLHMLAIQGEYQQGDIKTETLGPRTVTFKDQKSINIANGIIGKYRTFNIF